MARKQKLGIKILTVALGVLLLLIPLTGCLLERPEKSIVFADMQYDTVQVHGRIAAFILENGYGYQTDFIPCDTFSMFVGLERGDMDISMELWVESAMEAYEKAIASGKVIDLGTNFGDAWEGWLVPTFVIKGDPTRGIEPMAPDLKSIEDLPKYWELFKDPEELSKGRFHNGIPGWLCTEGNSRKLKAYGLDEYFTDFISGSDAALVGSMVAAHEKGEPWFGYYYDPTWVLGKLDMAKLEEPPFDREVWEATRGCAYPPGRVIVLANVSLLDRAPEVVEFLRTYETTATQNSAFLAYMQEKEASTEEAAIYFLQENESTWTKWVPADIADKVKAALP